MSFDQLPFKNLSVTAAPHFILLAEDDIDDQELLVEAFRDEMPGIMVHVVNNGKKAIEFLKTPSGSGVGMIVLDYNLPEINGAEVLKAIGHSNQFQGITKIVYSTSDSPFFRKSCLGLGAKAYLVKPSSLSGLHEMARMMLELGGIK